MQISFAVTAKLISAFVFATGKVQSLFFLNPKFQASSHLLCLYSPVCVRPVRKPHCWFSHEVAQIIHNSITNEITGHPVQSQIIHNSITNEITGHPVQSQIIHNSITNEITGHPVQSQIIHNSITNEITGHPVQSL